MSSPLLELFERKPKRIKVPGENVFLTSCPNLFYLLLYKSRPGDPVLPGTWLALIAELLLSWMNRFNSGRLLFSGKLRVAPNKSD